MRSSYLKAQDMETSSNFLHCMLEVIVETCTDPAPSVIQVDDLVSNVQSAPVKEMNVKIRLSVGPEGNKLFFCSPLLDV